MESWFKKYGMFGAGLGLCATLALAAGQAKSAAPDEDEEEISGDFSQSMGDAKGEGGAHAVMTTVDGDDTYSVTIDDGKVTSVEHNGKKLKKSQYRMKNGQVEILGDGGTVTKTIPAPQAWAKPFGEGGHQMRVQVAPRAPGATPLPPAPPGTPRAFAMNAPAPKVMLGVTMADADPDVLEQLGIEDGEGVMLLSVAKGLPAEQAGLRVKDIIVAADGQKLSGEAAFRKILKGKNPGDVVALKVIRKGENQEIKVTLAAYDAKRLPGSTVTINRDDDSGPDEQELKEILKQVEEQVKSQVEALRSQINSTDWNKVRDDVSAKLAEAMKHLEQAQKQAAESGAQWWEHFNKGMNTPDGQIFLRTPAPVAQPEFSNKLDKISEQLDRMNKRLDDMERRIDKK